MSKENFQKNKVTGNTFVRFLKKDRNGKQVLIVFCYLLHGGRKPTKILKTITLGKLDKGDR